MPSFKFYICINVYTWQHKILFKTRKRWLINVSHKKRKYAKLAKYIAIIIKSYTLLHNAIKDYGIFYGLEPVCQFRFINQFVNGAIRCMYFIKYNMGEYFIFVAVFSFIHRLSFMFLKIIHIEMTWREKNTCLHSKNHINFVWFTVLAFNIYI